MAVHNPEADVAISGQAGTACRAGLPQLCEFFQYGA
jgi:hypothetical protein